MFRTWIERFVSGICQACFLTLAAPALAGYVDSAGREWRPLSETIGISWDQLAYGDQPSTAGNEGGVCPVGGGLCSGARQLGLAVVDFSGWTWATRSEVSGLLSSAPFAIPFGGTSSALAVNSAWAPAVVATFGVTFSIPLLIEQSVGWSADNVICAAASCQAGFSGVQNDLRTIYDDIGYANLHETDASVAFFAAWLYRPVPSAPTAWLLALGLALLVAVRQPPPCGHHRALRPRAHKGDNADCVSMFGVRP